MYDYWLAMLGSGMVLAFLIHLLAGERSFRSVAACAAIPPVSYISFSLIKSVGAWIYQPDPRELILGLAFFLASGIACALIGALVGAVFGLGLRMLVVAVRPSQD